METSGKELREYTIDLVHIAKVLFRKLWVIILGGVLAAAAAFYVAAFIITPQYSSSVRIYVNNSAISLGNTSLSISSSEISAAQSLVRTYIVILKDTTTLEKIIEKANLPYSPGQLSGMINAYAVNDTEIMRINVTCDDPYVAANIANCIADVLQVRISEIIKGTSMAVVGYGKPNLSKVSPNVTKRTAMGFLVGAVLAAAIIVVLALMDNTIHDEDYLIESGDYPLLAKIPDLAGSGSGKYGYKKRYGYYYRNSYYKSTAKEDGEESE